MKQQKNQNNTHIRKMLSGQVRSLEFKCLLIGNEETYCGCAFKSKKQQ